jgi:hypothetical protein
VRWPSKFGLVARLSEHLLAHGVTPDHLVPFPLSQMHTADAPP